MDTLNAPKYCRILTMVHVDVCFFFQLSNDTFRGESFIAALVRVLSHSSLLPSLHEHVRNGSLTVWGKLGEVDPPHLFMPLTIEPSKPRFCYDERFLNLSIMDLPFSLDKLTDLPRYVGYNHYIRLFFRHFSSWRMHVLLPLPKRR